MSKPASLPPMRVVKRLASKRVIGPIPPRPCTMLSHALATVLPTGETMPSPVTTTRRLVKEQPLDQGICGCGLAGRAPACGSAAAAGLDVVDGLLDGGDLLGLLVGDFALEGLLERHY